MVISGSTTKLEWYDMPLYPYMALLSGSLIFMLINKISNQRTVLILLSGIFVLPLYNLIKQSYSNSMYGWEYANERGAEYLFEKINQGADINNWAVADTSFNGPFLFYKYRLKEKNQILRILKPEEITEKDKVIVTDNKIKQYINKKFQINVIDSSDEVMVYEIKRNIRDTLK